jgi:nucleoid-associated protein YgaU
MRKDVRIGLSIGGVLLAVLIVYLLVPKDANPSKTNTQKVARTGADASAQPGAGGDASASTGQGASASADPGQSPAHAGQGTNPGGTAAGPSSPDNGLASRGNDQTAGTGTGTGTGATTTGPTDPSSQAEANNGGADWAKILEGGIMPESMMATRRDPFADDNAKRGAEARNTPGPQPDWSGTTHVGEAAAQGQAPAGGTPPVTVPNTARTPAGKSALTSGAIKDHTIQPGETFSSISLAVYGDSRYWKEIKKANPTVDDTKLKPGMVVKLPDLASVKAAHTPAVAGNAPGGAASGATGGTAAVKKEPSIDPSREYRVQPGDSLQKIALKLYGKAAKSDAIYELNREKIGGDSSRIKVGMVLKLPEAPTVSPTAAR